MFPAGKEQAELVAAEERTRENEAASATLKEALGQEHRTCGKALESAEQREAAAEEVRQQCAADTARAATKEAEAEANRRRRRRGRTSERSRRMS